jgi:hypothetical protein
MKPPYVEITARCSSHGTFTLVRKPNKRRENIPASRQGFYDAVKCPRCPFWATIIEQTVITTAPVAATNTTGTLPGLEG